MPYCLAFPRHCPAVRLSSTSVLAGDDKDAQYSYEKVLDVRVVVHDDGRLAYERQVSARIRRVSLRVLQATFIP